MGTLRSKLRQIANSRGQTAFMTAAIVVGFIVGLAVVLLVKSVEAGRAISSWLHAASGSGRNAFFITIPIGLLLAWALATAFW